MNHRPTPHRQRVNDPTVARKAAEATGVNLPRIIGDRPTVDQLREVLGLTPSGAVRLVDRLSDGGLVTREPGKDGHSRAVALTPEGREAAEQISTARATALNDTLQVLSSTERETLRSLRDRLMAGIVHTKDGGAWISRLCNVDACGRSSGHCPAANAAAAKYGTLVSRTEQWAPVTSRTAAITAA